MVEFKEVLHGDWVGRFNPSPGGSTRDDKRSRRPQLPEKLAGKSCTTVRAVAEKGTRLDAQALRRRLKAEQGADQHFLLGE
jgi:hypothetical protein